jgi:serine protease AprX
VNSFSTVIEHDELIDVSRQLDYQLEKDSRDMSSEDLKNLIETEFSEYLKLLSDTRKKVSKNISEIRESEGQGTIEHLTNFSKNLENLRNISKKIPHDEQIKLWLELLDHIDSSVRSINATLRRRNPDIDNAIWLSIANKYETFFRRLRLAAPTNKVDFEADLKWIFAQGEEEEDFAALQQARFNSSYFSVDTRKLFGIIEQKIRKKLTENKKIDVGLYKVFAPQVEIESRFSKINVITSHPGWSIVVSNATTILDLQEYYPLEKLNKQNSLEEGAHKVRDYIVHLIAPINDTFRGHLQSIQAELIQSLGGQDIVIAIPNGNNDILAKLKNLGQVDSVQPFTPNIRVQTQYLENLNRKVTDEMIIAARLEAAKHPPQHKPKSIPLPGILVASFFTVEDCQHAEEAFRRQSIRVAEKAGTNSIVLDLSNHPEPLQAFEFIKMQVGLRSLEEDTLNTLFNDSACYVIAKGVIPSNPTPEKNCLGLTGRGETIAICDSGLDTGDIRTLHLDFHGRVNLLDSYPIQPRYDHKVENPSEDKGPTDKYSGHGTHVTGSAIGNGQTKQYEPIKGVASEAELIFQAVEQNPKWTLDYIYKYLENGTFPPSYTFCGIPCDLKILFSQAYNHGKGARIYSISWGKDTSLSGTYDQPTCQNLDEFVWRERDFLVVVAAGNFGNCVTPPGIAKNCITVGASENIRSQISETYGDRWPHKFSSDSSFYSNGLVDSIDDIAPFSNKGPCATGRRKPDLVAPGTYILSTRSSQISAYHFAEKPYPEADVHYMYMHGTSMATPLVAGCAALVRQYLREYQINIDSPKASLIQGNPEKPTAALIKAILIHSAQYLLRNNPSTPIRADNEQGWGRIDLCQVLNPQAPIKVIFIDESQGLNTGELREYIVSIKEDNSSPLRVTLVYTDFPGENLINNLNLFIFSPNGKYYCGNDFEGTREPDKLNNVEGCFILAPENGLWRVRVVAESIAQGSQDYALVISGEIDDVRLKESLE